jgi:hypothetical protein
MTKTRKQRRSNPDGKPRTPGKSKKPEKPEKPDEKPSPGIGPLRKGELAIFGYTNVATLSEAKRHLALGRAVRAYGALSVFRKLNAVYVYTRYTAPVSSAIFKVDRDWVKEYYGV